MAQRRLKLVTRQLDVFVISSADYFPDLPGPFLYHFLKISGGCNGDFAPKWAFPGVQVTGKSPGSSLSAPTSFPGPGAGKGTPAMPGISCKKRGAGQYV